MTCFCKLDNRSMKQCLILLNNIFLIGQLVYKFQNDPQELTLLITSVSILAIILIFQLSQYAYRETDFEQAQDIQLILLTILFTENNLELPVLSFLQLGIFNTYFIQRSFKSLFKKKANFTIIFCMNAYIAIRTIALKYENIQLLSYCISESILLIILLFSQTQQLEYLQQSQISETYRVSKIPIIEGIIHQDDIQVSSLRASRSFPETDDLFFKTFDILPQGIAIIDKNDSGEYNLKYSNTAAQMQMDSDDKLLLLDIILNFKGMQVLQKRESLKQSQSNHSYNNFPMRKSSHRYVQKQPLFKLSQTFIHEHINSAISKPDLVVGNNYQRFPSVQAFVPKKSSNVDEICKSPSIQYSTPGRRKIQMPKDEKEKEKDDILVTLLDQMWGQLQQVIQEQHINSQQIVYIHESDTFMTSFKKQNQKYCIDLKIFTAVHKKKGMLVVILRDVSHLDYIKLLKDYNQQKSKTLSFVSHEFRTPLNCIISMLESVVEGQNLNNSENLIQLKTAIDNCKYILNLSNDLLDLAQIKEGKFKMNYQKVNLKQLLKDCLGLFEIQAKRKQISLNFHYDRFVPIEIINDANRIRQITINLIGNALKFTLEGSITINVALEENQIQIEVIDTGIGMRDEDQPKLFQAFSKIENKETSQLNAQGVGLGLLISNSISMQLNTQYKGLGFRSQYKFGSTFCFLINNFKDTIDEEIENYQDSKQDIDLDTKLNDVRRHSVCQKKFIVQMNLCHCPTILIVDDNQFNIDALLTLMKRYFQDTVKCEYTICGFLAQEKVLQRFQNKSHQCQPYKLIFMDVEMPFQNGIVTAKNIKQIYQHQNQKVIIVGCSGYVQENSKQECMENMDDYVIKPVQRQELERVISTYYFGI